MKDSMRWVWVCVLIGLGRLTSAAVAPAPGATGVDAIRAYAGVWKVEIERFDTAQSKAGHEKTTLHNACWMDGGYFACNQYVDGESKVLLVFTYSAKDNLYTSYQIPQDGSAPGSGKLKIEGNVWTFPWQVSEGDKTTYFHVVNVFTKPGEIDFRQEFSTDQVHWTVTARGHETKVSGE